MLKEQHHYCCVDWGELSWSFVLVLVQSNQPGSGYLYGWRQQTVQQIKQNKAQKTQKRRKLQQVDSQLPLHCRAGTYFLFCYSYNQDGGGILQVSSPTFTLETISNLKTDFSIMYVPSIAQSRGILEGKETAPIIARGGMPVKAVVLINYT